MNTPNIKVTRVRNNIPMEPTLKAALKRYADEEGLKMYKVIEKALKAYFKANGVSL